MVVAQKALFGDEIDFFSNGGEVLLVGINNLPLRHGLVDRKIKKR